MHATVGIQVIKESGFPPDNFFRPGLPRISADKRRWLVVIAYARNDIRFLWFDKYKTIWNGDTSQFRGTSVEKIISSIRRLCNQIFDYRRLYFFRHIAEILAFLFLPSKKHFPYQYSPHTDYYPFQQQTQNYQQQ